MTEPPATPLGTCRHCGAPSDADTDVCDRCFDLREPLWAAYHFAGGPDPLTQPCPVPGCSCHIRAADG